MALIFYLSRFIEFLANPISPRKSAPLPFISCIITSELLYDYCRPS